MKKRATTCYLERRQLDQLRALSNATKVPVAELIRQGIDRILEREESEQCGTPTTMTTTASS